MQNPPENFATETGPIIKMRRDRLCDGRPVWTAAANRRMLGGLLLAGFLSLGGCASLPSAGPLADDIADDNASSEPYGVKGYVIVDVTPQIITALKNQPVPAFYPAGFDAVQPDARNALGVGDGITISIWEAGAGGLFTSAPAEGFLPGARNVIMPEQVIAPDGSITIPYVGRVHVAGMNLHQVEDAIQARLVGKAIEPQVTVVMAHSLSDTISVMGEVGTGGRLPVGPRGMRVLEAIAAAGGIHIAAGQAMVQIARGGKVASIPFLTLLQSPPDNIYLAPGDVLAVVAQPSTVIALGATGKNAIIPFETVDLGLDEAIAKAGGLLDERADPSGVYVLRFEPAALAARLAPSQLSPAQLAPDAQVPVVFHLDLKSVTSYFRARQFTMRDKDMIYVANARLSQVQKFLALVNAVISPAVTGITIQNATK